MSPAAALALRNPMRLFGVYVFMLFLYTTHSRIIENVLSGVPGVAMSLALVTLIMAILSGDLSSAIQSRPGLLLIGFTMWIAIGSPFSVWMGGVVRFLKDQWVKSLLIYFMAVAIMLTFEECRKAIYTMALATMTIVALGFKYGVVDDDGRLALGHHMLSNPNDLSVYLLIGAPFCVYALIRAPKFTKPIWIIGLLLLLRTVLKTGSRGALLAIVIVLAYLFFKSKITHKMAMIAVGTLIVVAIPIFLTDELTTRYATIFADTDKKASNEAEASKQDRIRLFKTSLKVTALNPLFGVGAGQFAVAGAEDSKATMGRADWHETHNTYTQVSSETGIPGLVMYVAALVHGFRCTTLILRLTSNNPAFLDMHRIAFCMRLSWLFFLLSGCFGSLAYNLPVLVLLGLSEAMRRTALTELAISGERPAAPQPTASATALTPRLARI